MADRIDPEIPKQAAQSLEVAATPEAELDFPTFRGHEILTPIVALGICDGHEIQFGKSTASL
jgi:hypothetical protein